MRVKYFSAGFVSFFLLCIGLSAFAQRASRFRSGSEVRSGSGRSSSRESSARPRRTSSYNKKYNIVEEDGKKVLYKKRNTVEFDDSMIEGEIRNPSDFYFVHRPEEKFGSLLQKRKNFQKEMLRDAVMIR